MAARPPENGRCLTEPLWGFGFPATNATIGTAESKPALPKFVKTNIPNLIKLSEHLASGFQLPRSHPSRERQQFRKHQTR